MLLNTQFSGSAGSVLSSITHQEAYLYYSLNNDVVSIEIQKKKTRNISCAITYSMPLYTHDSIGSLECIGAEREKN